MADLGLDGTFQEEHFNPNIESIEEWFANAPSWLRRSWFIETITINLNINWDIDKNQNKIYWL